jgi:gas vesicle structural protein
MERRDKQGKPRKAEVVTMVERYSPGSSSGTNLIDVLDRVLDKGIVIDAWVRVSLVGIDLVTVEARIVVASIDTYLRYAEAVGLTAPVARPAITAPHEEAPQVGVSIRTGAPRQTGR